MKRPKIIIIALLSTFSFRLSATHAQIPDNYRPNFAIQEQYDKIVNDLFVEIQAKSQIGQQISTTVFAELYTLFDQIIPSLPNTYSFNIIYQQCLTLSQTLSNGYNLNTLASFMENCFKPFIRTVDQINKDYTIQASAILGPITGPAPLSVTLDARASTDPSNQTIPSDNFFRYYRDTQGIDRVIGRGNVINYTFDEPGNYRVHLTVRSSNQTSQGILDGNQIFTVDVAPRAANIVAFANGQRLRNTQRVKLGLQEGQRGIVLDGSATTPRGGRQLIRHRWNITGPNGFTATRDGEGTPGTLRVVLPDQGEYTIRLTVFDNQNNELTDTFSLAISDPVAIIRQSPEVGNTSVRFNFDGAASYSITSRLRLFTWDIFDSSGNRIETFQGRSIDRQFTRPGSYTVRLNIVDEQGQENTETRQIFVESTPPVAQFLVTPVQDILYPSEFILDASASSDIDVDNGFDNLSYSREFSNPTTEIVESLEDGKIIRITFNEVGSHTVKLTVSDDFGKMSTIERTFDIQSTLRPRIVANPTTTTRGTPINFAVQTNKNVLGYERDFGDGTTRSLQDRMASHTYSQIGIYTVKLRVSNGPEENEVRTKVFIGEQDRPIPGYEVQDARKNLTLVQNQVCEDNTDGDAMQVPAYQVDRYQDIRINASSSVNSRGERSRLKMFFQPRNDQIFRDQGGVFTYRFNDLGCQFVNLTVEDEQTGRVSAVKVRFRVVNALPRLDNLVLSYPQFGNSIGVGFQEASAVPQDVFITDFDPLIVRVSAVNAIDPDGSIAYFQWYYYDKNDPARILATKLSPGDIPHTFFSVPRMPGEFMFGVRIFDNDGGSQRSEDIIGNGPVVFFPPDTNRPDIPIVTLRVDRSIVDVGNEITFDVISRVLSDRPDFVQERVIQIDFNGDGERDLTTKSDRITYAYTRPSGEQGFTPRASVVYRGYRGVAQGENIIVRNALRPRLLFDSADTTLLVRDVSLGDIEGQTICMDSRFCDEEVYVRDKQTLGFIFNYADYGRYVVSMDIFDQNANNATQRRPIELEENKETLNILSIPQADKTNPIPEIFVGNNLDNSILFYIKYNNPNGVCYVDIDINVDTTNTGNPAQNEDFPCNQIHLQEYIPTYQSLTGRIYYEEGGTLQTQDFIVSFLDFELTLDDRTKELYLLINNALESIDPQAANNQFLIEQLIALRDSVLEKNEVRAVVVAIDDTLRTQNLLLSNNEKETIQAIIALLSDGGVTAAIGGSAYEQAKAEILSIVPQNLLSQIRALFEEFENIGGTEEASVQEQQRAILEQIGQTIGAQVASDSTNIGPDQIDSIDMQMIVIPNICAITEFFNIPTQNCNYGDRENANMTNIPGNVSDQVGGSRGLARGLRILFIILGILVLGFIGLVIAFAIKAKMRSAESEGEEDEYIVPQEVTPEQQQENTTQQ